jgi:hypothetical protein
LTNPFDDVPGSDWLEMQEHGIEVRTPGGRRVEASVRLERGPLTSEEQARLGVILRDFAAAAAEMLDNAPPAALVEGHFDGGFL